MAQARKTTKTDEGVIKWHPLEVEAEDERTGSETTWIGFNLPNGTNIALTSNIPIISVLHSWKNNKVKPADLGVALLEQVHPDYKDELTIALTDTSKLNEPQLYALVEQYMARIEAGRPLELPQL